MKDFSMNMILTTLSSEHLPVKLYKAMPAKFGQSLSLEMKWKKNLQGFNFIY